MNKLLYGLILLIAGCAKVNVDNANPEFKLLTFNGQETISSLNVTDPLVIDMHITDNDELYEVLVKIENTTNPNLPVDKSILAFERFEDLQTTSFIRQLSISTDSENVSGDYEIAVRAVDANGNTDSRYLNFRLYNPGEQPEITINAYDPVEVNQTISIARGDSILINGFTADNTDIQEISVSLVGATTLFQQAFDPGVEVTYWDFAWLAPILIPVNAAVGDYTLKYKITDVDGNSTFLETAVQVF